MAEITIFQDEAFSVENLAAAISEQPYVPGRIGRLGLFTEAPITTTVVQIDYDGQKIGLVAAKPRGGDAQPVVLAGRKKIPFNTVHLPERSTMMADEIQGIRAFGSTTELESAVQRVAAYQRTHRQQLDMTHEWQRVGAISGKVLDADGETVLLDLYATFGIEQAVVYFDLNNSNTLVRERSEEVNDQIEDALGALTSTGVRAFCGREFWRKLTNHKSVRETYLNTVRAAELLGKTAETFEIGGITYERYRGKRGTAPYIPNDEAIAVPEGVPELTITRFAPADYLETVNTEGLPYYSKLEVLRFNKGVEIESQSNPLHLVTRPKAVIRLKIGAGAGAGE
ncbi:Uncharacterised protein [Bordetella ansorpii]|uniref:Phage protein n=1 Tax=Bordetella ansorpii TaxID=288768 RepID=A0A157RLV2_9BORD|nr:major capsid protein [Bordetella ansorpii]SAI58935.1 Uncharacterised protein [Bordetella ansorpii]